METPSSATTRRVTRSQTQASSKKMEVSDKKQHSKSNKDRSALIDITNDSPIVGLASGSLVTPVSKQSNRWKKTPGSGEALLRGQVKSLLQRVEEEAVISKFSLEFCGVSSNCSDGNDVNKGFSSAGIILAPTPANTPQVSGFSAEFEYVSKSPIEDQLEISQVKVEEGKDEITRSLFLDFSEKSDSSDCSSVVTYQGTETMVEKSALIEDDDASIWSIQVNLSTRDEDEEEEEEDVEIPDDIEQEEEEEEEDDGDYDDVVDELCEGMNKISVGGGLPTPKGKHMRFDYNSDDELVGEVLLLKGLPTPKGKHLRFQDDDHEEEKED